MEGDLTNQGGATAAVEDRPEDAVQPAAQPEAGASEERQREDAAAKSSAMDGFIRHGIVAAPTSKPDSGDPDGGSASSDDVKPDGPAARGADGRFVPRRGVPKALSEAEQRIADLERQLAERDPETIIKQAQERAKLDEIAKTRSADVERYRRLIETPDHQLGPDDYQWREDFKEKLAAFPEVQQFHEAYAEQRIAQAEQARQEHLRSELVELAGMPGVDQGVMRSTPTFGGIGKHLYESGVDIGKQAKEAELRPLIERLQAENQQLRVAGPRGLGSSRAPVAAGRSSAGAAPPDMDAWIRGLA